MGHCCSVLHTRIASRKEYSWSRINSNSVAPGWQGSAARNKSANPAVFPCNWSIMVKCHCGAPMLQSQSRQYFSFFAATVKILLPTKPGCLLFAVLGSAQIVWAQSLCDYIDHKSFSLSWISFAQKSASLSFVLILSVCEELLLVVEGWEVLQCRPCCAPSDVTRERRGRSWDYWAASCPAAALLTNSGNRFSSWTESPHAGFTPRSRLHSSDLFLWFAGTNPGSQQ